MNELELIIDAFEAMKEGFDYPVEKMIETVPNQGMVGQFLDWISEKSEVDQARFLSSVIQFRSECEPKVLELSKSQDENVMMHAYQGLLHTSHKIETLEKLVIQAKKRIDDFSLEEGNWPLHWILDFIVEDGGDEGLTMMSEIETYAATKSDLNPYYGELIERIMNNIKAHYSNSADENLPDYISKFTNLLK